MRAHIASVWLAAMVFMAGVANADAPLLPRYPEVHPGVSLHFPADHGAHPDFRNEWWYVTGWLETGDGRPLGFQVTFFRSRPSTDERNPSAFAPKQILFAHAALSDPAVGRLLHAERAARAGFGLAQAAANDTDVVLENWLLKRNPDGVFHTKVSGAEFALDLSFTPSQPVLLEGENGYSQKGPLAAEASYYYSLPHLFVSGKITRGGRTQPVKGLAWLDREWSSQYLDPRAVGWDWAGLNLDDGGALMAFRIRDATGHALWTGGSWRDAEGSVTRFAPGDVTFTSRRRWRSPHTGAVYPVETGIAVRTPSGERQWEVAPLFDDQELDSRSGGGPVYWEGAVRANGGRGYLELTGYFQPLKL